MSSEHFNLLLDWYHQRARRLPWRDTSEPYNIWISEVMLQQTQVKTVLPRYTTWMKQFPDINTLANAPLDQILKAWEGLGYYRRARFIHKAANNIMALHKGQFPEHFDAIMALPGVGRSTAGAIASFSFNQSTPVLDGNVKRVLKRWYNKHDSTDKQLWAWAQKAIDASASPGNWNQAMMELGATLCSPIKPDCAACPVNCFCSAAFQLVESGNVKKACVKNVYWQVKLHNNPGKGLWLTQRPDTGIWAGLWTPPIIELETDPEIKPSHIHLLTHRRLHLYAEQISSPPDGEGCWVSDISQLALPTGIHRLLEKHRLTV